MAGRTRCGPIIVRSRRIFWIKLAKLILKVALCLLNSLCRKGVSAQDRAGNSDQKGPEDGEVFHLILVARDMAKSQVGH